jgi:hypothetical protein
MTNEQLAVIRFAYLDLMGAKEAADQNNLHAHDWAIHWETIKDMEKQFPKELSGLITYGEIATDDSRSNGPHQTQGA